MFLSCFVHFRSLCDATLRDVCSQWRQHSQLLVDSDFTVVEPILALRSVAQLTLLSRMEEPENNRHLSSVLTDHLMELCRLARKAGNTQVASACITALPGESIQKTFLHCNQLILVYFIDVLGDQASKQFFVRFILMENCLG